MVKILEIGKVDCLFLLHFQAVSMYALAIVLEFQASITRIVFAGLIFICLKPAKVQNQW